MPDLKIRPLGRQDRSELEAFSCANYGEPWTMVIEEMVRFHLPANVDGEFVSGLGAWLDGQLSGVIAWRADDNDHRMIRSSLLAVRNGARRRGIARQLKRRLLDIAIATNAKAVVSLVHWDNEAMIRLNKQFDANVERIDGDRDYCLCVIHIDQPPAGQP